MVTSLGKVSGPMTSIVGESPWPLIVCKEGEGWCTKMHYTG